MEIILQYQILSGVDIWSFSKQNFDTDHQPFVYASLEARGRHKHIMLFFQPIMLCSIANCSPLLCLHYAPNSVKL